jgi:hypothetical protein
MSLAPYRSLASGRLVLHGLLPSVVLLLRPVLELRSGPLLLVLNLRGLRFLRFG